MRILSCNSVSFHLPPVRICPNFNIFLKLGFGQCSGPPTFLPDVIKYAVFLFLKASLIIYVCKIQYLHTRVHDMGVSKMMPIMMTGLMISQAAVVRWPSHWSSDLPNVNSDPEVPPTLARRKVVIINPWNFYFFTNTILRSTLPSSFCLSW